MEKEILKEPQFTDEIVSIIRSGLSDEEIVEKLTADEKEDMLKENR